MSGLCLVWVGSCPGCVCQGYVRVRVMSVSGLCPCPGYVCVQVMSVSGLCPVRVVAVRGMSCPGCVCPGCVLAPIMVVNPTKMVMFFNTQPNNSIKSYTGGRCSHVLILDQMIVLDSTQLGT